jgi:hypothetical protein
MSEHRDAVAAASAQWLLAAFPSSPDPFDAMRAQWQAREATSLAARLRYPTDADDVLLELCGPGGAQHLDWLFGAGSGADGEEIEPWRTWVDEVVVSWAAALLGDAALAVAAAAATGDPLDGPLLAPSAGDLAAAALLRHPDLLAPVADLHLADLIDELAMRPA